MGQASSAIPPPANERQQIEARIEGFRFTPAVVNHRKFTQNRMTAFALALCEVGRVTIPGNSLTRLNIVIGLEMGDILFHFRDVAENATDRKIIAEVRAASSDVMRFLAPIKNPDAREVETGVQALRLFLAEGKVTLNEPGLRNLTVLMASRLG